MSSTLKADLTVDLAHNLGVQMDDILDGAKKDLERAIGAKAALVEVSRYIQELHSVADKEIEAGTLDLESGKKVKLYITRAVAAADTYAQRMGNVQQSAAGKIQGLQAAVGTIKKVYDVAVSTRESLRALVPADTQTQSSALSTVVEVPKLPIKQRRLAEETAVEEPKLRKKRTSRKGTP